MRPWKFVINTNSQISGYFNSCHYIVIPFKFVQLCRILLLKTLKQVLVKLTVSLLLLNQVVSSDTAEMARFFNSFKFLWKMNKLVSSANNLISVFWTCMHISFTYIRNKSGPSTDPWGTPMFVCMDSESVLFTYVNCSLLLR